MLFPIILLFCSFGFLCHITASERRPREPCCSMTENISLARLALSAFLSALRSHSHLQLSIQHPPKSCLLGIHCKRKQPRGMNGRKEVGTKNELFLCQYVRTYPLSERTGRKGGENIIESDILRGDGPTAEERQKSASKVLCTHRLRYGASECGCNCRLRSE